MAIPSPGGFAPDEPTPRKSTKSNSTGWHDDATTKGTSKTTLIVVTLFAIVAIGGAIAALLLQPNPPSDPLFVAVPIGEYDPPFLLPPAVYRDAALVTDSFPERGGRPTPAQTFNFQEKDKFEDLLNSMRESRGLFEPAKTRPLVLYVAGLAAVQDKSVYLIPARAHYGDPSTWIPISRILDAVSESKAKKKVLILDVAYSTADPFGGQLRDDVSTQLDDLLATRENANGLPFVVLTSAGPGELSLSMTPQRHSGFAFYLAEGLRGAADGYHDNTKPLGDRDKTVSVSEVARFVHYRVERWSRIAHDRRQIPKVYGLNAGTDFMLSDAKSDMIAEPDAPLTYTDAVKAGWESRAAARAQQKPLPAEFARLTDSLLRAERVWFGSGDSVRTQDAWALAQKDWDRVVRESAGKDPVADVYAKALAVVAQQRLAVDLHSKTAPLAAYVPLRELMREAAIIATIDAEVDPTRKLEKEKERTKALETAKEKTKVWEEAVKDADTRTRMFWDVIAEGKYPTAEITKYWRTEFASAKFSDRNRATSEVVLVNALAEVDLTYIMNKRVLAEYPTRAVAALLQAEAALSQLLAMGPNGFPLVAARVHEGETLRTNGQKDLFTGTRTECENAHVALTDAAKKYQEARADLMRWQDAAQVVETATGTLIDTLPGEMIGPQPGFDDWLRAADKTTQLANVLSAARTANVFRAEQVPQPMVDEVRRLASDIRASFIRPKDDEQPAQGLGGTRAKPADLLPLEQMVATTLISPARRKAVWDAIQVDALKFHTSARQDDATDVAENAQTKNALPAKLGERPSEDDLASRRGQASVAFLKLAGHPRAAALTELLVPLMRASNSVEAARALGTELRTAWVKEVPNTARAARVAPPGLAPYRTPTVGESPGVKDANADVAAYLTAARTALETDRLYRGNTASGKTFYATALRNVKQ